MYRCESWTIKEAERQRTDAFELCWRRLLRSSEVSLPDPHPVTPDCVFLSVLKGSVHTRTGAYDAIGSVPIWVKLANHPSSGSSDDLGQKDPCIPGGSVVKTLCSQSPGHGFSSWLGSY